MRSLGICFGFLILLFSCNERLQQDAPGAEGLLVDFRYQPRHWQTCFGLKDDFYKSVVADNGSLWYEFVYGNNHIGFPYPNYCWERNKGFRTAIIPQLANRAYPDSSEQGVSRPELPVVRNTSTYANVILTQTTLASYKDEANPLNSRFDVVHLELKNSGQALENTQIRIEVNTTYQMRLDESKTKAYLVLYGEDDKLLIQFPRPVERFAGHISKMKYSYYFDFKSVQLEPGDTDEMLFVLPRSKGLPEDISSSLTIESELDKAKTYWDTLDLPYNKIEVPDSGIQNLLNSAVRNIYQAREIKDGIPAFQVGPTFYRGTWAVDGPFFMEAMTYLGQADEVRQAIEGIFVVGETQGDTGESFSKQAGLRLWMIVRHAELTGDYDWLEKMWPFVSREVENIKRYRSNSYKDGNPLTDGMMPEGNSDGGIGGIYAEYTNNYWVLSGLLRAIEAAEMLDRREELADWKQFFDAYFKTFNEARERDKVQDPYGNVYVPTFMGHNTLNPTSGQWAFMHSVFPGKLYSKEDPLVLGTMNMLDSSLVEGLILGTGWLPKGLWTYAASFHGHAHLWLGNGDRVPQILYDFANHASPLLCWSEEQHPVDFEGDYLAHGDMPHNWASVDFIRLIRHSLALERGNELHLFEGLPSDWLAPGMKTGFNEVNTTFGKLSFELLVNKEGDNAVLELMLEPHDDQKPDKIVIHQQAFNGNEKDISINWEESLTIEIELN